MVVRITNLAITGNISWLATTISCLVTSIEQSHLKPSPDSNSFDKNPDSNLPRNKLKPVETGFSFGFQLFVLECVVTTARIKQSFNSARTTCLNERH